MKYIRFSLIIGLVFSTIQVEAQDNSKALSPISAEQWIEAMTPRTFCRFVPERADDFAFENNLIAFRFYGPALRDKVEGAGCDCWTKRVEYPIIDKWYSLAESGYSYHTDRGEGMDGYKVGSSAGTGGTALWIDGERAELDCYTKWEVVENSEERIEFILTYEAEIQGSSYKEEKSISLEMDERMYRAESTFWKDGKIASGLPVCVGLSTQDGAAYATADPQSGWISCWEILGDGSGLGTAAAMDPEQIISIEYLNGMDKTDEQYSGHILMVAETSEAGKISYAAGYGWELAGDILSQDMWTAFLRQYCKSAYTE